MKYRSRPQTVEAVQWTGDNFDDIQDFGAQVRRRDGLLQLKAGKDGVQEWVPVPVAHWVVRQDGDLSDHWLVDPDYFAAKYRRQRWVWL